MSTALGRSEDRTLVNYSRQINDAHQACLQAKELGGKKAHECGTWLLKQKAALPHGAWLQWVKQHCEFNPRAAQNYMAIAGLEIRTAMRLSIQGCLWEVAAHKVEQQEIEEERQADIAKGKKRKSSKMDEFVEGLKKRHEYEKSLSPEQFAEYKKAQEEQEEREDQETQAREAALRKLAEEFVTVGYREMAKRHHPDHGGCHEDMALLPEIKKALLGFVKKEWGRSQTTSGKAAKQQKAA